MGFRFRKSFKLMPGVRVNLSKGGLSTTIGGRGASVNIGKKGAFLNTSIPGTGLSSRQKIGGGASRTSSSSNNFSSSLPQLPQIPKPASTRWFSFGVSCAIIMAAASLLLYFQGDEKTKAGDSGFLYSALFCTAFGFIWWFVRTRLRANKQNRYDVYQQKQLDDAAETERLIQESQEQRRLTALAEEQALTEKTQKAAQARFDSFQPQLNRARQLLTEGLITESQLNSWEKEVDNKYADADSLKFKIDLVERPARKEKHRRDIISSKYDDATAGKLINMIVECGMTREQLIDAYGPTIKIERTLTKRGERETLIYGSKSSGSYFHIENGIVTKAVVR